MLRRARWFILLALAMVVGFVAFTFVTQSASLRRDRPAPAEPLPLNTSATAMDWEHDIKQGDRTKANIRARSFQQIKEPSTYLLEGLEMRIFDVSGSKYDLVKSERASFDVAAGEMYSEGEVEITMNLPREDQPAGRLLRIRSSGMTFDAKSSRVRTERHAVFEFDQGDGESVGASYDPAAKELRMDSAVKVNWRASGEQEPAMRVEAGELVYREAASEIYLLPWARLTRGTMTLESANAVVVLKDGALERVDARQGRGVDSLPNRRLEYEATQMVAHLTPKGEVRRIEGGGEARVVSATPGGVTTVTSDRVDLEFEVGDEGSVLQRAVATGRSRVESDPAARAGARPPRRVLSSDVIELRMRAGGREIEQVQTHTPGQVEFIPAKEGEKRRQMNAQRLNIDYGADNMVREFRAAGEVATRTESLGRGGKPVVAITRSQDLKAEFNEKTGEMTRLEQWTDFEYEEGARRATAGHAELDQAREVITLRTKARMWDEAGSTAANEIVLEQKSGDMRATGQVSSTRVPDKKDASGGMLAGGEPLRAQAQRMTATDRNRKIRYDGDALMWQGASRLRAQVIVIDREQDTLSADGDVVSTLPDQSAEDKTKKRKNVLTTVRAASLVYSDKTKLAHYTGGTRLERPGLEVVSRELRVWLREDKDAKGASETRLERAFADGDVRIVERAADRTREGAGEHAEYYPEEERMVLNGGNPVVSDSKRGVSRGREITWYARQDRLIVDNTGSGPSVSRIQRDERR